MKKCWTCRRRRLKCDGALPHCQKCQANGVECLGYGRSLTWVGGMARRGQLKDWTVDQMASTSRTVTEPAGDQDPKSHRGELDIIVESFPTISQTLENSESSTASSALVPSRHQEDITEQVVVCQTLTDPIFRDLTYDARFFIDYFEQRVCPMVIVCDSARNPYRGIIPLISSSKAVVHAIMALAACHYAHSKTAFPSISSHSTTQQSTALSTLNSSQSFTSNGTTFDLLKYQLFFKHKTLRHLSQALADPATRREGSTLATVVLLLFLDVLEGGAGSWDIHLEGANKLLEFGGENGHSQSPTVLEGMIDGLILFHTFGSTLVRPGVVTRSLQSSWTPVARKEAPDLSIVGCPTEIRSLIALFGSHRQSSDSSEIHDESFLAPDIPALQVALDQVKAFGAEVWATDMASAHPDPSSINAADLMHLCMIWKLTTEIYASRILYKLTGDMNFLVPLVDEIIKHYNYLERNDDLLKCLIWPTFIVGAECRTAEQREWVGRVYEKIWWITLSANTKNAVLVLASLWKKQDLIKEELGDRVAEAWDWLGELSSLDDKWLFF